MSGNNLGVVAKLATAFYPLIPEAVVIDDLWIPMGKRYYYTCQILAPPYLVNRYPLDEIASWTKYASIPILKFSQKNVRISVKAGNKIAGIYFRPKEFLEKEPWYAANTVEELQEFFKQFTSLDDLAIQNVGQYLLENYGLTLKNDKPLLVFGPLLGAIHCIYGEKFAVVKTPNLTIIGKGLHRILIDPLVILERASGSSLEKFVLLTRLYDLLPKLNKIQIFNVFVGLSNIASYSTRISTVVKLLSSLEDTSNPDRFWVSDKLYYKVSFPKSIPPVRTVYTKYIGKEDLIIKKEGTNG